MFKKACFFVLLLLCFSTVWGIRLVEPISKELSGNDFVGTIVPGQKLELIFSKELGKFNELRIDSTLLNNFNVKIEDYLESIKVFITANDSVLEKEYDLNITLIGDHDEESSSIFFVVSNSLLDVSLLNYSSSTYVDSSAEYEFFFLNNSDADAKFKIKVLLPNYWLEKNQEEFYKIVVVPKKSSLKDVIRIVPRIAGAHTFTTEVFLENENTLKEFTLFVESKPTFKSKFNSVINGLPFYSISIFPSYLFNGFISLLFG